MLGTFPTSGTVSSVIYSLIYLHTEIINLARLISPYILLINSLGLMSVGLTASTRVAAEASVGRQVAPLLLKATSSPRGFTQTSEAFSLIQFHFLITSIHIHSPVFTVATLGLFLSGFKFVLCLGGNR